MGEAPFQAMWVGQKIAIRPGTVDDLAPEMLPGASVGWMTGCGVCGEECDNHPEPLEPAPFLGWKLTRIRHLSQNCRLRLWRGTQAANEGRLYICWLYAYEGSNPSPSTRQCGVKTTGALVGRVVRSARTNRLKRV